MKTTMKQYSFASQLKSLAVVFGIALTFVSCAKEEVAQNPTNKEGDNDKNLTTFVAGDEAKTRTSLNYNSGDFYWKAGDYIYVKDDNGVLQKSSNAPTSKVASFKYKVPGKFGASASYKVYYLGKNSNGSQVTISATQSQSKPNNTEHFGTAGDYGTATATGAVGGSFFSFQLKHQPAYLVFQPYTSNTAFKNCYLTKVEVTSDNDIAETYTVNTSTGALTGSAGRKQIVLTTSGSSTNPNGFPLTNSAASVTTNGAYMVIKPGTHTLTVRYWVKDVAANVEGAITKTLPATAYASNTYYDMTANLNVRNYDGDKYYMWDAQQNYWAGHEWNTANPWQPVLNNQKNDNYPKSKTDPRYWNESFSGKYISNPAIHSCKDLPNVNELTWYVIYGNPSWDKDELWTTMGHLYKGGMWFMKKSVLQAAGYYNSNTAVDGTDWRIKSKEIKKVPQLFRYVGDKGNYFFLPALGFYHYNFLSSLGKQGVYWSSSAFSGDNRSAYNLGIDNDEVWVSRYHRFGGFRAEALFE